MKVQTLIVAIILVSLTTQGAQAAGFVPYYFDNPDLITSDTKPKVAISLSGGGARALVNVGVLKALEEAGVPIDLVVGTSMGALVAILYGSGMPLAQIEELVTTVDLSSLFHINAPFTKSLLNGERFNQAIEAVIPYKNLEDFPITTALLSFDLNSGVKYVHTTGPISQAIQGPYAIPGIFPGVDLDQFYLLDAGIQELAPSLAARELGAQVVITTTAFDKLPYSAYDSPVRAWTRMINLIKEDYSIAIANEYSDVVIAMDVGAHSLMDFQLAQMFIDYGYQQALEEMPAILRVLDEEGIELVDRPPLYFAGVEETISDLRRDRLIYPATTIRPLLYYGWNRSAQAPTLFPTRDTALLQYGLALEKGAGSFSVLATQPFSSVELTGKLKKITPELDLVGAIGFSDDAGWSRAGIQYSGEQLLVLGGLSVDENNEVAPLVHTAIEHDNWQAEGLLQGISNIQGYGAARLRLPLRDKVFVQGMGVYHHGEFPLGPMIYRGELLAEVPMWQWSGELIYQWESEYTKEILQLIQFTGAEFYSFVDGTQEPSRGPSLGAGARFSLRLLGLKPSSFDGYLAYDLERKASRAAVSVNLSF